jgi:hypothetical protein
MLEGWHEFYGLLGTAAAALAALLFVAASIGTGFMSTASSSPTRTFTSPVLFQYTYVLFVSLVALMPDTTATSFALIVGVSAAAALAYSLFILRRVLRSNVTDIEDHIGYGASPPLGYAATLAAAIFIYAHSAIGPALLAGALIFSLHPQHLGSDGVFCAAAGQRQSAAALESILIDRAHLDLRPGAHFGEHLHVAERFRPDVAGARQPRLVRLRNRRAAETDGNGVAVRPIGDLARRDDGARVFLAGDPNGGFEIHFFTPGQRRARDRQRFGDRLCGRRVEQFGIERKRAEFETDLCHENPYLSSRASMVRATNSIRKRGSSLDG